MNQRISCVLCAIALALGFAIGASRAQDDEAPAATSESEVGSPSDASPNAGAEDLAAIRNASRSFVEAFDAGDAAKLAAHWTENGDYTDDSGRTFTGRAAIEQEYASLFAAHPGAKLRLVIDSLKLLSDSAAIEDGRATVEPAPAGAPAIGKYTAVHVKVDGQWLMSTVRDTRVETPSSYGHIADLEWMIGTWVAEEHGAKTESVCRWVANKSFVERAYTSSSHDGAVTSGVQLIGWNPQSGQIQSWSFTSDGGHAVGVWSPHEGGWSAEIQGTTGEGAPTTAVNHLTRLDDGAYVWRSTNRTVAGQPVADSGEVVMKRQSQ